MKAIGEFLYKYWHAALLLYFFPYMMWFGGFSKIHVQ